MTTKDIRTSYAHTVCDVCGRTLLRGEKSEVYINGGARRHVCELCKPRALHEGWVREGTVPDYDPYASSTERRRSLFSRLRNRRDGAGRAARANPTLDDELGARDWAQRQGAPPPVPALPRDEPPAPGEPVYADEGDWDELEAEPLDGYDERDPLVEQPDGWNDGPEGYEEDGLVDDPQPEEPPAVRRKGRDPAGGRRSQRLRRRPARPARPVRRPTRPVRRGPDDEPGASRGENAGVAREPRHVRAVPTSDEQKVAAAVNLFNQSEHRRTVAGVARSLGGPSVSVLPVSEPPSLVHIVLSWELCWYRYAIDLADDVPGVRVDGQGYELSELTEAERQSRGTADESGQLTLR